MTIEREYASVLSMIRSKHRGWITYRQMARDIPHHAEQFLDYARQDRDSAYWWIEQAYWMRDFMKRQSVKIEEAA